VNDIFISYASADRPRVKPLVDALQQQGWSVWWDRTIRAGRTFDRVIEAALKDARCVIVLWSRTSIESDWVRTEADEAKRRGILVPALIDDVEIPLAFRRIQAANLVGWSGALPSAQFDELALAVSEVLSSSASPAPDAEQAAAEKARLEQEERLRKAAEEKARQQKLEQERQTSAEHARLYEERRLAAEKAQQEQQERQRKAAEAEARPFLSKNMMIGLGVGAVVLLLGWILWPRGSDNRASQPQTAVQQPQTQTTVPQTQPQTAVQKPPATEGKPQTTVPQTQPQGTEQKPQTAAPQTQPQSTVQQPQPAAADVKKPVAKNCPEGVYCDSDTTLMWTIKDNGKDINWHEADQYCKNLTLAGLSDWELPTIDELAKLYDPKNSSTYKIRNPLRLTACCPWSSTKQDSGLMWYFGFNFGWPVETNVGTSLNHRALCVRRSGK
jgi:hypothetical protein